MKESWTYYDYVRRWWRIFSLGVCLGALVGFGFYLQQVQDPEFGSVVRFEIVDVGTLQIVSGKYSTEQELVEWIDSAIAKVQTVTGGAAIFPPFVIEEGSKVQLWKPTVLGSTIGGLLIVGLVYVWGDVLAYHRNRHQISTSDADLNDP